MSKKLAIVLILKDDQNGNIKETKSSMKRAKIWK